MNTHQILYSKQMILAKLNGWKSVTRRPIKPNILELAEKGLENFDGELHTAGIIGEAWEPYGVAFSPDPEVIKEGSPVKIIEFPYKIGDQLWTKENYDILDYSDFEQSVHVNYKADGHQTWVQLTDADWQKYRQWKQPTGSKSKLFMFKTLARFWDEVTEITVERVQDIPAEESWNEGIRHPNGSELNKEDELIKEEGLGWPWDIEWMTNTCNSFAKPEEYPLSYKCLFRLVWQSMYKGGPFDWQNNPYVWVVRYKPLIVNHQPFNAKVLAK